MDHGRESFECSPNESKDSAFYQSLPYIDSFQHQKWGTPTSYDSEMEDIFPGIHPPLENPSSPAFDINGEMRMHHQLQFDGSHEDWDPQLILNNLSVLEQQIHQLQAIIRSVVIHENPLDDVVAHQQLARTELASIIIQLISTAGTLLPSLKKAPFSSSVSAQMDTVIPLSPSVIDLQACQTVAPDRMSSLDCRAPVLVTEDEHNYVNEQESRNFTNDDRDIRELEDAMEVENLPPGSYEILQLEKEEILAPHAHFCSICGKGFKRDANLRMHMRGHGDEYKTSAALSKPIKDRNFETALIRRYSCPYFGCKRNKDHEKFQPLKTILCVKNHYKRSHCDKSYTCSRCNSKKFSVIADLKTHEKHCGRDKWLCSCGTTFSRKDKLFGHVALFQGHAPVLSMEDNTMSEVMQQRQGKERLDISASGELNVTSLAMDPNPEHGGSS